MASTTNTKVATDVPMLDEMVYNCKMIILDGIILKDDVEADSYETESSIVQSDLYMASVEGNATFSMFVYDEDDIAAVVPHITSKELYEWSNDNSLIPSDYHDTLLKNMIEKCINTYYEENEYYRIYGGLPPTGDPGIFLTEDQVPVSLASYVDFHTPLHRQDSNLLIALENEGLMDTLYEENPDLTYLRYVGKRKIDIYEARKAEKFAPLYVPECDVTDIRTRFQELLELNRSIYLKFYYDEAYDYNSDYYQKFSIVMIILQTFTDMVTEIPEYLIRRDVFDIRTVQYLFEASGVEFFQEIPLRYQITLVRNLNRLIKYKSSDKCIADIVTLFGFENIEIFKYYILKSRKKDADGNWVFATETDPNTGEEKEILDDCYSLKFLKVNINELADDAIKDTSNFYDYEEFTRGDQYWVGDYNEDHVRQEILSHDFNILRTKYMSINSLYSMEQYSFQITYFLGLVTNHSLDLSMLIFEVPQLGVSMNIEDAFIFMYALAHAYYGTEDKINTEVDETLKIMGFNFDADLEELANHLWEEGVKTFEDMGITGWTSPSNGIFTFNQLMNVYTKNKAVYDHVVHEMRTASNRRIYKLYKMIYDALFITEINTRHFVIDDQGTVASSFAEYLDYESDALYAKYDELINLPDESRNERIATAIYNVACAIEEEVDMNTIPYIFTGLPAASIEAVKVYIMDMINFFKSFKVTIKDLNTVYVFDDYLASGIIINDDWRLKVLYDKIEKVPMADMAADFHISTKKKEDTFMVDRHYIGYRYYHDYVEDEFYRDAIKNISNRTRRSDRGGITRDEVFQIAYCRDKSDKFNMRDSMSIIAKVDRSSKICGISKDKVGRAAMHTSKTDRAGITNDTYSIKYVTDETSV